MTFEILTMSTCRWSVRNIGALIEKRAPFQLVDVAEGGRKASWYPSLTPLGKTPALRHAGGIVVESLVINEYLEEVAPGRKLLPERPLERAWARTWSAYCDEEIMKRLRAAASGEPKQRQTALSDLDSCFATLEAHLFQHASAGALWGGAQLSLTDLSYWSLFDVLARVETLRPAWLLLETRPRLRQWGRDLLASPTLLEAVSRLEGLEAH
jgi:glutathione S-transferase